LNTCIQMMGSAWMNDYYFIIIEFQIMPRVAYVGYQTVLYLPYKADSKGVNQSLHHHFTLYRCPPVTHIFPWILS
jgi:hypothetical protein